MNRLDLNELLTQIHDPSARVRRAALLELCPCHVRADIPGLWNRML